MNNIKNKVIAFVGDFKKNGVGAIKTAFKDMKDNLVLSIKNTANKLKSSVRSKEDFMGLVKSLSEKYSISKLGDRLSEVLANINDRIFGI